MAYTVYKPGEFFILKDDATKKPYMVTNYDNSDGTVKGVDYAGKDTSWKKNDKVMHAPHSVRVMSVRRGKSNPAVNPEKEAAKLRKAMAKVAELEEYKKFL